MKFNKLCKLLFRVLVNVTYRDYMSYDKILASIAPCIILSFQLDFPSNEKQTLPLSIPIRLPFLHGCIDKQICRGAALPEASPCPTASSSGIAEGSTPDTTSPRSLCDGAKAGHLLLRLAIAVGIHLRLQRLTGAILQVALLGSHNSRALLKAVAGGISGQLRAKVAAAALMW